MLDYVKALLKLNDRLQPPPKRIKPRIVFVPLPEGYPRWFKCSDEWWYRERGIISTKEIRGGGTTPELAWRAYCRHRDGVPGVQVPFTDRFYNVEGFA